MACYAPNTPSPISSSQIGYSVSHTLNTLTATSVNEYQATSVFINNIPVGVWSLSGNVYAVGPNSNSQCVTHVYASVLTDLNVIVCTAGFKGGTSNPLFNIYTPYSGVFYSDGTSDLSVNYGIASTVVGAGIFGSIVLTKIA